MRELSVKSFRERSDSLGIALNTTLSNCIYHICALLKSRTYSELNVIGHSLRTRRDTADCKLPPMICVEHDFKELVIIQMYYSF
jgi:hypothetical protein